MENLRDITIKKLVEHNISSSNLLYIINNLSDIYKEVMHESYTAADDNRKITSQWLFDWPFSRFEFITYFKKKNINLHKWLVAGFKQTICPHCEKIINIRIKK